MSDAADVDVDDCLAVWCAGNDWCAITCTMAVIGNKCHPVIVSRLLDRGSLRFDELVDEVDGITNETLSESLDDLEETGLVERTASVPSPWRCRTR